MFFKNWIQLKQKINHDNCDIFQFDEIPKSRQKIYEQLVQRIISHYTDSKRIKKYLDNEKYEKLEDYINRRIPTKSIPIKGDYGEIFGVEHLKQFHNYEFPITKLMIKLKLNKSLEGEDILGFYIENNKITKICVGEAKVRTRSNSTVLNDAIDQLENSYKPHPVLLKFYSDMIYPVNEELGDQIEDLMSTDILNNIEKSNWIFYITGFKPQKFNIKPNELENLVLVNMCISDLNDFVTNLFEDCRSYYHEE